MAANDEFTLIAITPAEQLTAEGLRIAQKLRSGFHRVHLRHPGLDAGELEKIIRDIPQDLRQRVSLHDHFELAKLHGLGGVHLNSRNLSAPGGWTGLVSRSCHSVAEVEQSRSLDYVTLSPVFDSISKPGYTAVDFGSMPDGIRVIALGGVTPDKFEFLKTLGYSGAALLSAAWP